MSKMFAIKLVKGILILGVALMHVQGEQREADETHQVGGEGGEARIIYDQRQSGKYNIHVVIKDVAIIEMDQNEIENVDYGNDDYYYDENDLTVRPITLTPTVQTTKLPAINTDIEPSKKKASTTYKTTLYAPFTTTASSVVDASTTLRIQADETTEVITTLEKTHTPSETAPHFDTRETLYIERSNSSNSTGEEQQPFMSLKQLRAQSKVEAIYASDEERLPYSSKNEPPLEKKGKTIKDSKIFKFKVRRSHQPHNFNPLVAQLRRCRSNQVRDVDGICRTKRSPSGSILKRLFKMLIMLPFNSEEKLDENL